MSYFPPQMASPSKLNPNAVPFMLNPKPPSGRSDVIAVRSPSDSYRPISYGDVSYHYDSHNTLYGLSPCFYYPRLSYFFPAPSSSQKIMRNKFKSGRRKARRHSPQKPPEKKGSDESGRVVPPFPSDLKELELSGKTTVMLKNIPNHFRRRDLIRVINRHCRVENSFKDNSNASCKTEYDFLYLPMDFNKFWQEKKTSNLGYAFVNFTTPFAAWKFYQSHNKYDWKSAVNNKVCEVTLAKIQGRESLEENFITKRFFCHSDEYLPLVLNPACDGMCSFRRSRNIGIRVPTMPRHPIFKDSARA